MGVYVTIDAADHPEIFTPPNIAEIRARARREREESIQRTMDAMARANVMAALRFLSARYGAWKALAEAMGLKLATVHYAASQKGESPVEEILSGAFFRPGTCPHCGRR